MLARSSCAAKYMGFPKESNPGRLSSMPVAASPGVLHWFINEASHFAMFCVSSAPSLVHVRVVTGPGSIPVMRPWNFKGR